MKAVLTYIVALVVLLGFDFAWLTLTGDSLYRPAMGALMSAHPNLVPAAGFYAIYALALCVLVILPETDGDGPVSVRALTLKGAVFGLAAFATYDLTALSIIPNWPLHLSFIDMAWGTFNATLSANVAVLILRLMGQVGKAV